MKNTSPSNGAVHAKKQIPGLRVSAAVFVPILIGAITVGLAILAFRSDSRQEEVVRQSIRTENRLKMESTLDHAEEYFGSVYSSLFYISLGPNIQAMDDTAHSHVQALFDHNWEYQRLSEIYVIKRDFDGSRRPFMTFEYETEQRGIEDIHSPERETDEYRIQIQQIRRFTSEPALEAQISPEILLCVEQPGGGQARGVVYSVPIVSEKELVGIVAAMIPTKKIEAELERGNYDNMVVLANERGDIFGCEDLPDETWAWFEDQFEMKGCAAFFAEAPDAFRVGKWSTLWTPANIRSEQRWWLVFQYDEAAISRATGLGGYTRGWGNAAAILCTGFMLALLVRSIFGRLEGRVVLLREQQGADDMLRAIVEGTSGTTGSEFFRALVSHLASALRVRYAVVGQLTDTTPERVKTVAVWAGDDFGENFEYDLAGTPCQNVVGKTMCLYARNVQKSFPDDSLLVEMGVESYLGIPLFDSSRRPLGLLAVLDDKPMSETDSHAPSLMTIFAARAVAEFERQRAEKNRLRMEARLWQAQKMESLNVMAGSIAHNFNNMLQGVLGYQQLALNHLQSGSSERKDIEEASKAAKRAAEMSTLMLTYVGQGKKVVKPFNLSELAETTFEIFATTIPGKISRRINLAHETETILGDPAQIQQLVMNLVANAVEAIGDEEGSIFVTTKVMACNRDHLMQTDLGEDLPEGDYVVLDIADTGCGMDRKTQARAFEPFFTTKFTGRGLGLAAVLGIVRGHKGTIELDSKPGRGTTVRVLFPATDEPAELSINPPKVAQEPHRGATILFVDDEEVVRDVGKKMLEKVGFTVLPAADGYEAVGLFRERANEIDCVLLDLSMPGMDGSEVFNKLREIREDVPVIIATGFSEEQVEKQFAGKGRVGIIQKPYQLASLAEKLCEVLGTTGEQRTDRPT